MDIMIDIETCGTGVDACVLTIAAQCFDPLERTAEYSDRWYYARVDPDSQPDRNISDGTIEWWATQPKAAQEEAGQVEKLKTMIASELVNVGCGLMSAKQLVDAAVISARWWPSTRCIGFEPLSASAMHGRSDGRRSLWPAESDLAVGKSGPRHGRSCRSVYSYRTDSHVFHCRCRAGTCDRNPQARS